MDPGDEKAFKIIAIEHATIKPIDNTLITVSMLRFNVFMV